MKTLLYSLSLFFILLINTGCSSMVLTNKELSKVITDKTEKSISLFTLQNYTDTPRAGLRATNILEGVLTSHGYNVKTHIINETDHTLAQMQIIAKNDNSSYFLSGGVSEWRYKTGIDGEPAVSFTLNLYDTKTTNVHWSATASDSNWGISSLGKTAQDLIEKVIR